MRAILFLMTVLISFGSYAGQGYRVKGRVTDGQSGRGLSGITVTNLQAKQSKVTDREGNYQIEVATGTAVLEFRALGYLTQRVSVNGKSKVDPVIVADHHTLEEDAVQGYGTAAKTNSSPVMALSAKQTYFGGSGIFIRGQQSSQESYQKIKENKFINPLKEPLSTFAADVDAASYSNVRRFINSGSLPEKDAVRVEEMINYFQYEVAAPKNGEPVNIVTELTKAPWNTAHQLMRVTLKAKDMPTAKLKASNLVFLIDVSGSMMGPGRLPLVKASLKMLVDQLRDIDHVAIVTYAG